MMCRSLQLALVLTVCCTANVEAQSWAQKMFGEQKHDFGVVARGAEVVHRIEFKNIYKEDVHITGVKTACGCTAAETSKTTIKSGETAVIRIEMDTKRFSKQKDSSVIITFDRPLYAQVRIPVSVYIRTDVVITPGSANFGTVDLGKPADVKVDVAYAGRADWKILNVKTLNDHLEANVVEKSRSAGTVNYEVHFRLAEDTPVGLLRQQVQLITDDKNAPRVPLLVEARVEADLTVTPAVVAMGTMTPGQVVQKTVVVRGKSPFAIDSIVCESDLEAFATRLPKDSRAVHVLPLTFTAPDRMGDFTEEFTVKIPGRPEPLTFKAYGTIAKN